MKHLFIMTLAAMISTSALAQDLTKKSVKSGKEFSVENCTFNGKDAIKVFNSKSVDYQTATKILPIKGTEGFKNGTIEIELSGDINGKAKGDDMSRGFVGIAFRVRDNKSYECVYVRPANGRADDQIRRNHSVQYTSMPQYTWRRLREEEPKRYETYADMALGEWMKLRIEVDGENADIYINDAKYPTMVVNDIKSGADKVGGIALWLEPTTMAYFRNLKVTRK